MMRMRLLLLLPKGKLRGGGPSHDHFALSSNDIYSNITAISKEILIQTLKTCKN